MNTLPTFEDLAGFIREFAGFSSKIQIEHSTQFEKDLGITGDDGCELLKEAERYFQITLSSAEHGYIETFRLKPNEHLFHGEGFDLFGFFRSTQVRAFTVGELYDAICKASQGKLQA